MTARYREATTRPVPRPRSGTKPATSSSQHRSPVMGIIAWIVLGLGAGLLANMLIPGRRSQGLILTCIIGIAGALLGGWAATKIFHLHHPLQGFFNASTWLTAIAGAAVLLLIYHLATANSGRRPARR